MERRHSASAQPTKSAVPSKTNVPAQKTTSEASLTPSQFAAFEAAKGRKNPLDALSRMSLRQKTLEKRSGLQDVDEEFLKGNVFAKQASNRHSGLNNVNLHNVGAHTKPPAGQPSGLLCNINQSQMNASMQPQVPMNADGTIPAGGAQQQAQFVPSQVMPQQVQQTMQQAQQPQMVPSSPGIQQGQGQGQQSNMNMGGQGQGGQQMQQVLQQQVPQQMAQQAQMQQQQMPPQQQQQMAPQAQMQQQMPTQLQQLQQAAQQQQLAMQQVAQQQQQMQQPAAGQPSGQQYVTAGQQQIGQQGYTQPAAGQPSAKGQPIKQNMTSPANTMIPPQVQPEPDMCTTCPNCQTTIYLVRPDINEMQQMQQQAGGVVN